MGKASSSKKVARAASTGGGRTSRGDRPWGWYLAMAVVAALGVLVIVSSREQRQAAHNPLKSEKPRPPDQRRGFSGDHWHAAYGVFVCDEFLPPITSDRDPLGIHTHNDGVIHIHPFTRAAAGRKATLGVFADAVGMTLSESKLKVPGGETWTDGERCGKKKGSVRVFLNGDEHTGDPKKIRLRDRDLLVIAFAPEGAEVPTRPPTAGELDQLTDVPGSPGATTPTAPAPDGPATTVPPEGSETTVPQGEAPGETGETGGGTEAPGAAPPASSPAPPAP